MSSEKAGLNCLHGLTLLAVGGARHCMHCLLTLLDNTILEETSLEKTQGNGKSLAAWGSLTKGRLTGTGRLV